MKKYIAYGGIIALTLAVVLLAAAPVVQTRAHEDALAQEVSEQDVQPLGVGPGPVVISRTYTLDADFDEGVLINVNHDTPNNDQIQLNTNLTTFPFIWIALSGRGTVVKINTETGQILGEYLSSPDGRAKNPSRTTVDMNGNVWVTNRDEDSGGLGSAVHIGLKQNSQCVDRNGNGVIDTSTGLGDVKPWSNAGGIDDNGGVATAEDECILHYTRISGRCTRHVSINADNNAWIGGNNCFAGGERRFDLVDGATGSVLQSIGPFNCGGYGGLVDGNNIVWSAGEDTQHLLRYDPATGNATCIGMSRHSYGLAVDNQGNVWNSHWTWGEVTKVGPSGNVIGTYSTGGSNSRGVAVTADDNIWIANSGSNTVTRLDNSGSVLQTITVGAQPTGVAVDAAGKVWVTNLDSSNAMRIDPATNQVDLTVDLGAGAAPYNYSDMTGIVAMRNTAPQGTWTVIYDSEQAGTPWGTVSWTSQEPTGGGVSVRVRSSEMTATLGNATYVDVSNGADFDVPNGRYLQVEVKLLQGDGQTSPIVYDVTVQAAPPPCTLLHDKTAAPDVVYAGGAATVTLWMKADPSCLVSVNSPVDVMLVLDRSGSMSGQKLTDAKQAAVSFVNQMNLAVDQVGVASFASSGDGNLDSPLSQNSTAVADAINGLVAGGMTDIKEGLEIAANELITSGHAITVNAPVIILLSDGHHNESSEGELQAAANRIKAAGVRIITIGLGNEVNETQLRNIASSASDYYYAPNSSGLLALYQTIAPTTRVAGRNMVLTDTLSSYVTLIPGTFGGPISPTVSGNQILWQIAAVPVNPITLTYRVALTGQPGSWDTNDSAIATYTDPGGNPADLIFPIPQVTVLKLCEPPNLSDIQPIWGCVEDDTSVQIFGSGFFTLADFTYITGTFSVKAFIGQAGLTIHNYDANLINAQLGADSGLGVGVYDVQVVNTCAFTPVVHIKPYTTTQPPPAVLPPPEIYTGTLPGAFRLYRGPQVVLVRPPEGYSDLPFEIVICGDGFAPGTIASIQVTTGTIPLGNQAVYGDKCLVGTVPQGLEAGQYTVVVQGPCGTATGTYRVLPPALNDDLWAIPEELRTLAKGEGEPWVSTVCVRECDEAKLGLVVHRRGGKTPVRVDVRFYEGDPAGVGATSIGTGTIPLMSPGVPVPPDWSNTDVISGVSTSLVNWTPSRGVGEYVLYAVIDPSNTVSEDIELNNVVSRTVQVLPCGPGLDQVAPVVTAFDVQGNEGVTYDQIVPLAFEAIDYPQPGPYSGTASLNVVEYLYYPLAETWTPVKVGGWQTFTNQLNWTFYPEGGQRFLQAWVSDHAGNISRFPNFKMINYVKPCDYVARNTVRIYNQPIQAGQKLAVEVSMCEGDADLYIWPPDWSAGQPPAVSNKTGKQTEFLYITNTVAGEYMIEVYGYTNAYYSINIEVEPASSSSLQHEARARLEAQTRASLANNPVVRSAPARRQDSRPRQDIIPVDPAPFGPQASSGTVKLLDVTISGAASGQVNQAYAFTAQASPLSATLPITYTWQASGMATPQTRVVSSTQDVFTYTWAVSGSQQVVVTADNTYGQDTYTHTITIQGVPPADYYIYLPVVLKNQS